MILVRKYIPFIKKDNKDGIYGIKLSRQVYLVNILNTFLKKSIMGTCINNNPDKHVWKLQLGTCINNTYDQK